MELVPAMNVNILSHKYMNMYRFTALQPDPQMKFYFCFYDFSTFSLIVCSLSDLFFVLWQSCTFITVSDQLL